MYLIYITQWYNHLFLITDSTFIREWTGINATIKKAEIGKRIWNDRNFTISNISKELLGATLFHSNCERTRVNASIVSNKNAEIFIALTDNFDNEDVMNALNKDGWKLRREMYLEGEDNFGCKEILNKIWSKKIDAGDRVPVLLDLNDGPWKLFMKSEYLVVAILIKEGRFWL